MLRIISYFDENHLYAPNDQVTGCIKFDNPSNVKSLQLHLTGTIHVASPWVGVPSGRKHDLVFISVVKPVFNSQSMFRAGRAYSFSIRLPARVRWDVIKRHLGLDIADTSPIAGGLPPSFSDLASTVSIKYELIAKAWAADDRGSSRVQSRETADMLSPAYEILVRGGREIEIPDEHPVTFVERYCASSYKLDQRLSHERSLSTKLSDLVSHKQPPHFSFDVHFTVPKITIAGQELPVKILLHADDVVSTGANAPAVFLSSFKAIFRSYTHIQIPKQAGSLMEDDSNVYVRNCHVAPLDGSILLKSGVEYDLRRHIPNMGMRLEDVPSFETYGIRRSFSVSIVGSVLVAGKSWGFSRKQDLKVLSAVYEPAPDYEPAEYMSAPFENDAPPPYHETYSYNASE